MPWLIWKVNFCIARVSGEIVFCLSNFLSLLPFADVMVLNDIIEQAAGRQSRTPEQGGNVECLIPSLMLLFFLQFSITLYHRCVSLVWWASYHFDVHRCWNSCTVFSIDIQCWRFLSERLVHSRPTPIRIYSLSLLLSLCLSLFFLLFNFKVSFDRKLLSITLFH